MRFLLFVSATFSAFIWAQNPVDSCTMCQYVVNQAISHYKKGESKGQLGQDLLDDCQTLKRFYGQQAVQDCDQWVRAKLDVIFSDLQNGKTTTQVCTDMGECGSQCTDNSCLNYQCFEDSEAHCGPTGYLIGYGLYFCNKYYDHYDEFDAQGKAFVDCVRPRLQSFLTSYFASSGAVNCNDLLAKAFDSHPQIYVDCNFCTALWTNIPAIWAVLDDSKTWTTWQAYEQVMVTLGKCAVIADNIFTCWALTEMCDGIVALTPNSMRKQVCDAAPSTPCICQEIKC